MTRWRIKTVRGSLDLRKFCGTLIYFIGMLRGHGWVLTIAFLVNLVTIGLTLAAPWPVQVVIDHIILDKPYTRWLTTVLSHSNSPASLSIDSLLLVSCMAVVGIAAVIGFTDYVAQLLQAGAAHRIGNSLRRRLFKHLQCLSLNFHQSARTGDLLLRLTGDVTMVRDMLVDSLFDLAQSLLLTAAYLFVMFQLSPRLAWIALGTLPLVVLISMIMSIKLRAAVKKAREKEGDLISVAGEVLASISLVQAFTREQEEKERFSRMGRSSLRAGLKTVRLETQLARSVQIVTALGTCGILYGGVGEVRMGILTPGMLIVFLSYFNGLLKPIRQISKTAGRMAKASGCAERIKEILETEPEIKDSRGAVAAPPLAGRITFDDVSFGYRSDREVLQDIRFDILPGQHIALVGPTGAGKSTLIKLLLRFFDPTHGAVCFDGVDIRDYTVESLRRQISVVQQETVLFGTTVGENIAMGRAGTTLADVRAAAGTIGIDDWIMAMPNGYDTKVGERGVNFSGGQRQLIALARAVVRNGRILIFDEPTTGLDSRTEATVRAALRTVMRGRTTLIISHGARPLADVDRVFVMREGRIVQEGTGAQLLEQAGLFRELFASEEREPEDLPAEKGATW
ncbi:MAG TPA: ABC transporter ATP-binding protein [Phycisphaerae bacterium]|nr:ABC transporter ATP-binding protein [Phycisphaerae bacterium]